MAAPVNRTYPVVQTLTMTTDQDTALKALAKRQGVSVRHLLRTLIDSATNVGRLRMTFSTQLQEHLAEAAYLLQTTPEDLVARYTTAGLTHDLMRLGALPRPKEETE